ncbi:hypothetical protein CMV_014460 [Castanea mollissima]|uniref:Defective in cullin neddylation protein n=1 Tax=Castanea mollissima TaxID=60419 RepID=A0A8J4QXX1_9ROSI|nr:hypothetical protein CMV_014460 [Castanea mollissima]
MDEMNWMIVIVMGFNFSCLNTMITCLDFLMLVVSWHMKAATMCEFFKQEFIGGLQGLGIDSLEKFCEKIPFMCMELKDDRENTHPMDQKSLALDTAIGMWQLQLAEKQWPLVEHWSQFLQARHNKAKSWDTWSQLLEFARKPKLKTKTENLISQQSSSPEHRRSQRKIASEKRSHREITYSQRIGHRSIGDRISQHNSSSTAPVQSTSHRESPNRRSVLSVGHARSGAARPAPQASLLPQDLYNNLLKNSPNGSLLTENKGSDNIRGMMIVSPEPMKLQLEASCFEKMKNLKFLMVGFLLSSLPSNFRPQKLVALNMPQSRIILDKLFERIQSRSLTHMNFQSLRKLILQFGRKLGLPQDMKCSGVKGNVLLDLHSHRKLSHQIDFSSQISLSEFKVIRNEVTFPLDMHLTIDFGETYNINVPGKKIPKWFNHQNIGSSILIWNFHQWQGKFGDMMQGNRNHVEISCKISRWTSKSGKFAPMIARIGVHVECICSPQNSVIVQDNSQNVDDSKDTVLTPLLPPCSTSNVSHTNLGCLSGLRLDGNGFELVSSSIAHPFLKRNIPSEKSALQTLKASDWHLEGAFESRHLEELFSRYKGKVLMEYGSEICPLQASPVLSSKQTV